MYVLRNVFFVLRTLVNSTLLDGENENQETAINEREALLTQFSGTFDVSQ